MDGGLVLQAVIAGLAAGAVYGLVAIGFTLVYRLTSVFQLAHGHAVGGASFVMVAIVFGTAPAVAGDVPVWKYAVGAAVVLVASAAVGAAIYLVAVRPFARGAVGWIGSTAAVALAIEGVLAARFPREAYAVPDALPFGRWDPISLPGDASIAPRVIYVLAVGVIIALAFHLLVTRGRFGLALSAIATEPQGARLVGLPVDRLLTAAFAAAGTLAGFAGLIGAPDAGSIGVYSGALLGAKAIAAAIVGGLVDLKRVYAAALALGVLESCLATLLPHGSGVGWRDVAPLLAAVAVLVVRGPRAAREVLG
jgi:branched-chain amino acid transport system permease protein